MFPDGPNPTKVQSRPRKDTNGNVLPLVLIHDGGGTTFGFWMLDSLHRDVWAVHNPHFWSGKTWEGGMDEMARHYIGLIRKAGIRGSILLGGWSLGGYLSVAMARMLAEDGNTDIRVAGLLLIDSPFHIPWTIKGDEDNGAIKEVYARPLMAHLPPLVQRAFEYCDTLLRSWALPDWDNPVCEGRDMELVANEEHFHVKSGRILYKPIEGDWITVDRPVRPAEDRGQMKTTCPPPAVMLRCTRRVATADGSIKSCRVDMSRDDPLLGWEQGYSNIIKAVLEVDSDHYGLFDKYQGKRIQHVTSQVSTALGILDSIRVVEQY